MAHRTSHSRISHFTTEMPSKSVWPTGSVFPGAWAGVSSTQPLTCCNSHTFP